MTAELQLIRDTIAPQLVFQSMNWTPQQENAYDVRQRQAQLRKRGILDAGTTEQSALAECEGDLHDEISAECKRRGWLAIHSRTDRRSTNNCGTPDFIIYADNGRTISVEAKTRTGKPSEEQRNLHAWMHKLGHECHLVRSLEEFLQVIQRTL